MATIRPWGDICKRWPRSTKQSRKTGRIKFVILPAGEFERLVERLEDDTDLKAIREAGKDLLYDREEAENYIFMDPVKRERFERVLRRGR